MAANNTKGVHLLLAQLHTPPRALLRLRGGWAGRRRPQMTKKRKRMFMCLVCRCRATTATWACAQDSVGAVVRSGEDVCCVTLECAV